MVEMWRGAYNLFQLGILWQTGVLKRRTLKWRLAAGEQSDDHKPA